MPNTERNADTLLLRRLQPHKHPPPSSHRARPRCQMVGSLSDRPRLRPGASLAQSGTQTHKEGQGAPQAGHHTNCCPKSKSEHGFRHRGWRGPGRFGRCRLSRPLVPERPAGSCRPGPCGGARPARLPCRFPVPARGPDRCDRERASPMCQIARPQSEARDWAT